jgi:cellulose synthase/poly-beta-1,6-N-acetylglucosamine synthase-like glycosyltransferase
MMTDFLQAVPIICVSSSVVYAIFHAVLGLGLFRHHRTVGQTDPDAPVSVLIAARNEVQHIEITLRALLDQTIAPREIIVVDDRSDDGTSDVVASLAEEHPAIQLVRVDSLPHGLAPKKHALMRGIDASTGDILCFTDADSIPPPQWLERLLEQFDKTTGVVVGTYVPTNEDSPHPSPLHRLLRKFIRYEKLRTTLLAAGSLEAGHPWMASGASFAYRRAVYDEVGGFEAHKSIMSGDDDLFLQTVRGKTSWTIRTILSDNASVRTRVPSTFKEFIQQRKRHFSAGGGYSTSTKMLLGLYHTANLLALAALPFYVVLPSTLLLASYAVKVSADLLLFAAAERHMTRSRDWSLFVIFEFFYALYVVALGPLGILGTAKWKEASA